MPVIGARFDGVSRLKVLFMFKSLFVAHARHMEVRIVTSSRFVAGVGDHDPSVSCWVS